MNRLLILTVGLVTFFATFYASWAGTYSGGDGSEGSPYEICSASAWAYLSNTSADWASGKYFIVTADFDISNVTRSIGNSTTRFEGIFDGNNHTVSGARMDINANYTGMFGLLSNAATVKDITFSDCSIKGALYTGLISLAGGAGAGDYATLSGIVVDNCTSTSYNAGNTQLGLLMARGNAVLVDDCHVKNSYLYSTIGAAYGGMFVAYGPVCTIKNCSVDGDSTVEFTHSGSYWVGSIAGYTLAPVAGHTYTVYRCSSAANIIGRQRIGGLVGVNATGTIGESVFTGTMTTDTNYWFGGIVAEMASGTLINCYNVGTIDYTLNDATEGRTTAGVVGVYKPHASLIQHVTDCYNAGVLDPDTYSTQVSHVVGYVQNAGSTVNRCYADVDVNDTVTVRNTEASIGDVTFTTTMHMKRKDTYTGWDDTVWTWDSCLRDGYPVLLWEVTQTPNWNQTCTPTDMPTPHCTPGEVQFSANGNGASCWYCVPAGWFGRIRMLEW